MKIRRVTVNRRKSQIELVTRSGATYPYPFARMQPRPTLRNPIARAVVDPELANEGVSFELESGAEGCVLLDQALDYNSDPAYVARMLGYRLSVEAGERMKRAGIGVREVARRLGTSPAQLYRLLDPADTRTNLAQLVSLLHVLGCKVDLVVKKRAAGAKRGEQRPAAA